MPMHPHYPQAQPGQGRPLVQPQQAGVPNQLIMGQKRGFKGAAVAGALGAGALAGAAGTAHAEEKWCFCQPDHYKCIACGQWNDVAIGGDHSATCGQCGSPNWVIGTAGSGVDTRTDPNHNDPYDGSDYGGNDHGDGGGDGGGGGGGGGDGGGNGD